MNVVYLTTLGSTVRRRGDRLEVWGEDRKLEDLRLFSVDRLVVVGAVQLTTQALSLLLARGVDVSFLSSHGRLLGSLVSAESRNVYLRLAQHDRFKDGPFRTEMSRQLVAGKLTVEKRLLGRYARNHPGTLEPTAEGELERLLDRLPKATSVDEIRGLEGAGAAVYYRQFARMLSGLPFPGRRMHPSTDPVNALLSLGYVLVSNELGALVEALGFDPAVAFLHGIRYGRKSLPLDLVEVFRQPVVDRLTLRLLNRGQLTPEDFEGGEKGLRLEPEAFKRYLGWYEEQLRSPSEGEKSPSWRDRLAELVEAVRDMVMSGEVRPIEIWRI